MVTIDLVIPVKGSKMEIYKFMKNIKRFFITLLTKSNLNCYENVPNKNTKISAYTYKGSIYDFVR